MEKAGPFNCHSSRLSVVGVAVSRLVSELTLTFLAHFVMDSWFSMLS